MRPRGRALFHGSVGALLASAVWLGAGLAPLGAAPPAPAAPAGADAHTTPEVDAAERELMRERLARRAADLDARSEMFRQAMQRLEQGESPGEVRRFVRDRSVIIARLLGDAEAAREPARLEFGAPPAGEPRAARGTGPRRPWPDGRPHERRPLSEEERQVVVELLEATAPAAWREVVDLRAKDPAAAEQRIMRLADTARVMVELRRRDPDLYKLRVEQMRYEVRSRSLAQQIAQLKVQGQSEGESFAQLRRELDGAVGRTFDLRIAVQAHEIAQLQGRLTTVQAEIAEQEGRRTQIIAEAAEKLIAGATQKASDDLHGGPRDDGGLPRPGKPRTRGGAGPVPASNEKPR